MADTAVEWTKLRRSKPVQKQRARVKAAVLVIVAALALTVCAILNTFDPEPALSHFRRDFQGGKKPLPPADNRSDVACEGFKHYKDPCAFVENIDACSPDGGFLNYLELPYCTLKSTGPAVVLLLLWLVFLFIALGVTAEEFFCPALTIISDTLKLSHNVAGVTFLALGNGAPDIFSVYSSINNVADDGTRFVLCAAPTSVGLTSAEVPPIGLMF
eukprot:m.125809 g.125809  ORF g.125809 m.125809 type:complete len:215 (-) comp15760_c0_seq2:2-646(-)